MQIMNEDFLPKSDFCEEPIIIIIIITRKKDIMHKYGIRSTFSSQRSIKEESAMARWEKEKGGLQGSKRSEVDKIGRNDPLQPCV